MSWKPSAAKRSQRVVGRCRGATKLSNPFEVIASELAPDAGANAQIYISYLVSRSSLSGSQFISASKELESHGCSFRSQAHALWVLEQATASLQLAVPIAAVLWTANLCAAEYILWVWGWCCWQSSSHRYPNGEERRFGGSLNTVLRRVY